MTKNKELLFILIFWLFVIVAFLGYTIGQNKKSIKLLEQRIEKLEGK